MAIKIEVGATFDDKDIKRAQRELEKLAGVASKQGKSVADSMKRMGDGMQKVGKNMTTKLTLPLVGLGAAAVKGFSDFESKMTQSTSIMGDVSDDMRKRMEEAARQVATTLGISHADAAESFYFLASAGMTAEQSIAALPAVAAFSKAGMFDMARATDLATDAQSALGLASDDANENLDNLTRVTDVFVKANTIANASVEQFAESITEKAGTALRTVGKDIEEGVAVLGVFADQGIKGSAAGTMLTRTMEGLQENAMKNADAFEDVGIQVYDANGAMRNMADITEDVENAFAGLSSEQKNQLMSQLGFNKLSKAGILALEGNSGALREYEDELRNAGGTVDEVASKQMESFAEQMNLLKANVMDLAIEVGPMIIDNFITPFVGGIKALMERIKQISPEQKKWAVRIAGLVAAAGPLLLISGKLISTIGSMTKVFKLLNLTMLANPVFLIVAALVALGAALFMAYQKVEGFREVVDKAFEIIKKVIGFAWENVIKPIFEAIVEAVQEHLMPVIKELVASFQRAWPGIQSAMETAWGVIQPILEFIIKLVVKIYSQYLKILIKVWSTVFKIVIKVLQVAWKVISTVFNAVAGFITGTLVPIFQRIAQIAVTVWNAVSAAISAAWDFIQPILAAIWSFITDTLIPIFQRIAEIAGQVWKGISNAISTAWGFIKPILTAVFNFIAKTLVPIFQRIGSIVGTVWSGISKAIGVAWKIVSGIFRALTGFITGTLVPIFNAIRSTAEVVWSAIRTAISTAWNIISGIFSAIRNFINDRLVPIFNTIKSTAETVWSGITTAIDTAWGIISGIFEGIKGGFQSVIDFFTGAKDTIGGIFSNIGDAISGAFRGAFNLVARAWNSTIGKIDFTLPSNPLLGPLSGFNVSVPKLQEYNKGGVVPGIMGEPQLAIVHGGEMILRPSEVAGGKGGGGGDTYNITLNGVLAKDKREILDYLARELPRAAVKSTRSYA